MKSIAVDKFSPVLRQREKITRLEGRLFELRREIEDARRELARLEAVAAGASQETA
jgi:hypothetical protein